MFYEYIGGNMSLYDIWQWISERVADSFNWLVHADFTVGVSVIFKLFLVWLGVIFVAVVYSLVLSFLSWVTDSIRYLMHLWFPEKALLVHKYSGYVLKGFIVVSILLSLLMYMDAIRSNGIVWICLVLVSVLLMILSAAINFFTETPVRKLPDEEKTEAKW